MNPAPAEPAAATGDRHAADAPRGPLRVLVAEDNDVNKQLIRAILAGAGHTLTIVDNGVEATRAIRALDGPVRDIPIIGLTANVMQGDRELDLAAGMTDYVSKPIDIGRLFAAIDRTRGKAPKRPKTDQRGVPPAPDNRVSVACACAT